MKRINEASYSRIYQHAKDSGTFAIIGSEDKDTHQDRYNELKQLVKTYEHNYEHLGYNRLAGTYKYQDKDEVANEKSLIIYGISKEDAKKLILEIKEYCKVPSKWHTIIPINPRAIPILFSFAIPQNTTSGI